MTEEALTDKLNEMKNRIQQLLDTKRSNVLAVYYTAGFPGLNDTVQVAKALEQAGADIIEIGIPFSDPVADGPTIQQSNKAALDNGMTLKRLISQVREIRSSSKIPVVLMGYLNPIYQYGVTRFLEDAAEAGVDGVIIPDLPLDEFEKDHRKTFEETNLCCTFLIAPSTSEERIRRIDGLSTGFVYAVSSSSTTGGTRSFTAGQRSYFERIRTMSLKNPFLVGFGISNHESFAAACEYATGAIVGSAFIEVLKNSGADASVIKRFVQTIKEGQ